MTGSEYQQLVEFLGRQFGAIERQFAGIDRRFAGIDRRFGEIGHQFAAVHARLDAIDQRVEDFRRDVLGHFHEVYRRLERLEQESQAVVQGLRRVEAFVAGGGRREVLVRSLEEVRHQVAALQARLEALEQRIRG